MSDQTLNATVGEEYQYAKITEQGVIRLAVLQPSTNLDAGLDCCLVQKSLADCDHDLAEHYVALSYVWGDPTDTRKVGIEGKTITITASLDLALRHIRDKHRTMFVWADGICINQKDFDDRNRQVPLMGGIYSTARHTIIFLGLSSKETDFVLHHCQDEEFSASSPPELQTEYGNKSFELLAEDYILSNKWFTRIWILQELVLSVDPWLQCGLSRVRWDRFCSYLPQLEAEVEAESEPELEPELESKSKPKESSQQINRNRTLLNSMSSIRNRFTLDRIGKKASFSKDQFTLRLKPLLALLNERRGLGVTNPSDMIYAHLGLTNAQAHITVDYNKSPAQAYEDFTTLFLNARSDVSILGYIENVTFDNRDRSLPSWVPDWKSPHASQYEMKDVDKTPDLAISISVPRVLGIIGWSRGCVKSFISRTSCSELISFEHKSAGLNEPSDVFVDEYYRYTTKEKEREDRNQIKIIKWMSNSPQGQGILEVILRSYADMISKFSTPDSDLGKRAYPHLDWRYANSSNFPIYLFPFIRSYCPSIFTFDVDDLPGLTLYELMYSDEHEFEGMFYQMCRSIYEQIEWIIKHKKETKIAILDTGEIVELPLLAGIGDHVVTLQNWKQHVILTPSPILSTNQEKENIAKDLKNGGLDYLNPYVADSETDIPDPSFDWTKLSPSQIRDWNLVVFSGDLDIHGGLNDDHSGYKDTAKMFRPQPRLYDLTPEVFAIR